MSIDTLTECERYSPPNAPTPNAVSSSYRPSISWVMSKLCALRGVSPEELLSPARNRNVVKVRREIARTCVAMGHSHGKVANALRRERSTITALVR